ncbi:guanine nucleotide-binding protein G(i) subunit alpha-like [Acanthaster planci]|uniref:Guanine nucleotide-binding protein G(I) subunit alpha-like n=1 Tax=Acanthaster planci TaxID=133434 RepID=A0A8B7XWS1_ACAPL|nr:guanine nucleotide-binding protein G(i) subunit alpha-like [Acanthaster planci]
MGSGSSAASAVRVKARAKATVDVAAMKESTLRNRQIDKIIKEEQQIMRKTVKLLFLGAGESGKSTFAKQIRLIHHGGFSESERMAYKLVIYSNLISGMRAIIDAMSTLDISYSHPTRQMDESIFRAQAHMVEMGNLDMTQELADTIMELWRDPGVQQCYDRSNEYQLLDSISYFVENVYRVAHPNWIPTDEDIVRSRLRTSGIIETRFQFRGLTFRLLDPGGQRSERQKWIHCFEDVTAVLFIVAISAYDQVIREDRETPRMQESMVLFASICNSKWFTKTAMMLFLNKCDIFEEKIQRVPLNYFFKTYRGPNVAKPARAFICDVYKNLSKSKSRQIYHHFTTAIDRSNVQFVFDAVADVVLKSSLNTIGML